MHSSTDNEYNLVEKILMNETVSTLLACIDNYKEKVFATSGWSFYPPGKFFNKDFYIQSLKSNETSTYVPRNEEINPEEYGNNEVINKESENYGRKTK